MTVPAWVVLTSFVGSGSTYFGPYPSRAHAARVLCIMASNGAVCRHECEHCGRDHSTRKEDWYGKLTTRLPSRKQET
mgnify:CR=1 FL=1